MKTLVVLGWDLVSIPRRVQTGGRFILAFLGRCLHGRPVRVRTALTAPSFSGLKTVPSPHPYTSLHAAPPQCPLHISVRMRSSWGRGGSARPLSLLYLGGLGQPWERGGEEQTQNPSLPPVPTPETRALSLPPQAVDVSCIYKEIF